MKLQINRDSISIIPETDQDKAFIEDTLSLKESGDKISLTRINEVGLGFGENKNNFSLMLGKDAK